MYSTFSGNITLKLLTLRLRGNEPLFYDVSVHWVEGRGVGGGCVCVFVLYVFSCMYLSIC